MWPLLLVAGALAGGTYLARRKSSGTPPPAVAPPVTPARFNPSVAQKGSVPRGEVKTTPPAGVPQTQPPPPEKKPSGFGIKLPGEFGQVAGAVPAAAKVLDLLGNTVQQATGSEAAGNVARVVPLTALGFAGQQAGKELASALGADEKTQAIIGRTAGLLVAGGPAALAVPVGEAVSAAVGAIGGPKAEQDLRNAVKELDPTSSTSTAGKALNTAVNTLGGLVKGIFG